MSVIASVPTLDTPALTKPQLEEVVSGHDSTIFRVMKAVLDSSATPSVRVDAMPVRVESELAKVEPTFSLYEEVTGIPFTASYLNIDKVYKNINTADQIFVKKIDSYINQRMAESHLQDTVGSASQIIHELESLLNLNEMHDPYFRAEKMAIYITALTEKKEKDHFKTLLTGQRNRNELGRFL